MARLLTSHDPLHLHALLGLLVLVDFFMRAAYVFVHGTAFPIWEHPYMAAACVLLHGTLSWSSLLLPLPAKRNFAAPMIWPEFRLHSIIFASRHVVCTLLTLFDWWPSEWANQMLAKVAVTALTSDAASLVTYYIGNTKERTTNAMPYPSEIAVPQQEAIKRAYTRAQFLATAHAVLGDATCAFAPLYGIQAAPFLMTLVRKNIVSALTYHRVYAIALYVPYVFVLVRCQNLFAIAAVGFIVTDIVMPLRIQHRVHKGLLWPIAIPMCLMAYTAAQALECYFSPTSLRVMHIAFVLNYISGAPKREPLSAYLPLFTSK